MCIKRIIREAGISGIVPIIITLLAMPALAYLVHEKIKDPEECRDLIIFLNQVILPVVSIMCPYSILSEHVNGQGNELFYLRNRIKILRVLIPNILYLILLIPYYIYIGKMFDFSYPELEYVRIVIIITAILGAYYCFSFMLSNCSAAGMLCGAYVAICAFGGKEGQLWCFFQSSQATKKLLLDNYFLIGVVGVLLYILGVIYNKRNVKFY